MAKQQPIASRNRTHLFIKKILKFCKTKHFKFAVNFSQLKSWVKSGGGFYLWLKLSQAQKSDLLITDQISSSALQGWSIQDLIKLLPTPLQTKWAQIKFVSRQPKKKKKPPLTIKHPQCQLPARWLLRGGVVMMVAGVGAGVYYYLLQDLPRPNQLTQQDQFVTTRIMSRDGQVLFRVYEDENRTLVTLDQIPSHLINATIAVEDKNFYSHHGFSPSGIMRAAIANARGQTIEQGGSTITQQLVKNRLLTPERTVRRKIRELIVSVLVELTYSKQEILEMYFNQVAYGGAIYGAEEAAQRYFGKSVSQLHLAESSMLAGLPAAPSVYSPFGATPELAKQRQREVLRRMVEDELISPQQAEAAVKQQLQYQSNVIDIKAPHFVMYVKKLLAAQYGEAAVSQGGLEVTTTLDLPLQQATQQIVTQEVEQLAQLRVGNGAALVTNPQTGEILAMVGSKDYFDFAHDGQVNVTLRPRQPGSSIKPLTYSLALEQGKTPGSIIDDSPITYHPLGGKPYSPKNYDGQFHGRVTLRQALASSYNVPAVKTLAEIGVSQMLDKAKEMGIDTWQDRTRFGLSLTLGGGEVRMIDMAELYSTFANYGYTVELNPILEVKNYRGEVLYRNTCVYEHRGCPKNKSLDAQVAYQITDILADNQARTPAFGPRSILYIPNQEVAVKTGTTNNLRDNWTVGYTTDRLGAVWVGNNDNTPMSYVASGITGASPIWNQIMRLLLSDTQPHRFLPAVGLLKMRICANTGTLPCDSCPQIKEEWFVPGTEPHQACNPEWFKPKDKSINDNQPLPARDQILEGARVN